MTLRYGRWRGICRHWSSRYLGRRRSEGNSIRKRQPHDKAAAAPDSLALCRDISVMHLCEALNESEPDAQPLFNAQPGLRLVEGRKYLLKHGALYADALIGDDHFGLAARPTGGNCNVL